MNGSLKSWLAGLAIFRSPGKLARLLRDMRFSRREAAIIFTLNVAGTGFESIGLAMALPVVQFIQAGGDVAALTAESQLWSRLVDIYAAVGLPVTLATLLVTSMVAILLRQIFIYLRLVAFAWAVRNQSQRMINVAFSRILDARLSYIEREHLGALASEMTVELQRAVSASMSLVNFAGHVATLAVYVAILLLVSPLLTGLAAVTMVLAALGLFRVFKVTRRRGSEVSRANKALYTYLLERLRLLRLVRLSHSGEMERAAVEHLTREQRNRQLALARVSALASSLIEPIIAVASLAILYLSVGVLQMSLAQIGLFLLILLRLLPVMRQIVNSAEQFVGQLPAMQIVVERIRTLGKQREPKGGDVRFDGPKKAIRFESVAYRYEEGAAGVPALDGVTFTVPAGQTTAIVGPSGSGKSTLVDLLVRLRDPLGGRILIDDTPLDQFEIGSLRMGIAFLPQSPQILNVSVRDHIAYGRPEARPEDIEEAARLAGAHDFVTRLPDGYETKLGETGIRLSGGERQRVDLARVMLQRSPVIIMDEPTSALDADSETAFLEALQRIKRETDTTNIIIGHRLSTVMAADRIVVLTAGRVLEEGDHRSLMASGGWYSQAVEKQKSGLLPTDSFDAA